MEKENKIKKQLFGEIKELRIRLKEAEETLSAIRSGEVDAIVVSGLQGDQVFTLTGAERAYRVLIETMNEGAASLNQSGIIIYCNQRLSEMIKTPLEKVIGTPMRQFIRASDLPVFDSLIEKGSHENGKGEVAFINNDGTVLPVLLSISALQRDDANIYGITVTDLTVQKHIEEELRRHRDNLEELVKDRTNELETSNQQLQEEITERKQAEEYQKMVTQVLELLNKTSEKSDIIRDIILLIKELTGFEAVGVRLKEGVDFPYYQTSGFSSDFVKAETYLCARNQAGELIRDSKGNPYLECMCGNVICGRTNPALPFFTKDGSFWTNSTTELLASTTEEDRQARTRNRCNGEGYESVALIPLRSDSEIIGLLQLNDRRKGMFTLEMVSFLEGIADSIGIALARKQAEEELRDEKNFIQDALTSLSDVFFVFDLNGRFLRWNKTMNAVSGYSDAEISSMQPADFFLKEDRQRVMEAIEIAAREGYATVEARVVTKNGRNIPFEFTGSLLTDYEKKPLGVCGVGRDITERKRAEESLRETRDYLEKLLNYANAPIVVWDPKFTITGFNHAFERLTGYKDKEVIGLKLHMFFPEATQEESLKKIVPTSGSEYWESMEIPILCKDGSIRIVLWNSANIYAKDATTLIATIAQGQNITERKIAEEKIKRLTRLYSMLSEINEVIIRIRGQKEIFRKACQIAVEKGLFRMTWIEHIDPDSHSLKSIVHGEYGEEYLDKIRISIKEAPEGLLPISTAIREGKYIICNDFKDDSCIHPCRDEAIKCGYYSMAAFPLQIGTHIIGAINFYSGEPHFFDDEEISTLTQLSADISFALEHIEQQEQLEKRIEDLEKFYEMAIGRELKIKGLKKEMEELKAELSQYKKESKYNSNERA